MATLEIRKISDNLFKHIPSDNLQWFVSQFYCKTDGDYFQVVENSGSKRGQFHYSDITVYDIGGTAENFSSSQALMQRLKTLGYTGFIEGAGGISGGGENNNTIIFDAGYTRTDNSFTFNADTIWNINGIEKTNLTNVNIVVPYSSAGNKKWVKFVLNANNEFQVVNGDEVDENTSAVVPATPPNTIEYISFEISDSAVDNIEEPITGNEFVKKSDSNNYAITLSGSNLVLSMPITGISVINLINATSIAGFDFNGVSELYTNKKFRFYNRSANPITLIHNAGGLAQGITSFTSKDGNDVVIPPNEFIELTYSYTELREGFRSWLKFSELYEKPTTVSELGLINAVTTNTVQTITAKKTIFTSGFGSSLIMKRSDSPNNISLGFQGNDNSAVYLGLNNGKLTTAPSMNLGAGHVIWHSGNFNPNSKANINGTSLQTILGNGSFSTEEYELWVQFSYTVGAPPTLTVLKNTYGTTASVNILAAGIFQLNIPGFDREKSVISYSDTANGYGSGILIRNLENSANAVRIRTLNNLGVTADIPIFRAMIKINQIV